MIKPYVSIFFMILLLTAYGSCSREESLVIPSQYSFWERTVDIDLNVPIPGHMDNLRRIFMNETGFSYLRENPEAGNSIPALFPDGTMIVKEIYESPTVQPGEAPQSLMAMVKSSGHSDARGGWLWVVKDFSTGKENIFTDQFCVTCHSDANNSHPYGDRNAESQFRDYLFHFPDAADSLP
jgi:hypothetical protein